MSLFTACSDDDEAPDYSKVIESEMAGNYKGTLTVTVEGDYNAFRTSKNKD